jgi:hypothetical protein
MPRPMSSAMLAALQQPVLRCALFAQISFTSATVYVWSGVGTITWNGQTWTGLGDLLGVAAVEDGTTVEARGISITLGGLDAALLADCQNEYRLGLPAAVYFGLFDAGSELIATPITSWAGRTDRPEIEVDADKATITINCESRLIDMNAAVDRRVTHQDQQMNWPGDNGHMFVPGLQELTTFWGGYPQTGNNV